MRSYARLFVLAMIVMSSVARADSRIGFASDRTGNGDIYKMLDDGSYQTRTTNESGVAHNPSIAPNGHQVIYDVSGTLTMNDFANPIGTPVSLEIGGYDVNAGPYINSHRDYRVLYTFGNNGLTEIRMITIDGVSHEVIAGPITMSPSYSHNFKDGAFCGSSHFVFVDKGDWTGICYQGFNSSGATGSPTCWFGQNIDLLDDVEPACDSSGTTVAWAKENADDTYAGKHQIWTMPTDGDEDDASLLFETHDDATTPVWSPGDGQIAFAWNPGGNDFEIYKINADGTGSPSQLTDNSYDDLEPSWGPAVLP